MPRLVVVLLALLLLAPATAEGQTLLTGDSMMYVVDDELEDALARAGAQVVTDSRVGSGVTKPFIFDWVALAREQAAEVAPQVTLVFLGAGDIHPIGRRRCCGPAWRRAYTRRAARMLRAWRREGAGRVYWFTLPTPRDKGLAKVHRRVDAAVRLAVEQVGEGAQVLDLVEVFTPGRRYRRTMRWKGRRRVVRARDGVHLTHDGARIAAEHVRGVLARHGLLPVV